MTNKVYINSGGVKEFFARAHETARKLDTKKKTKNIGSSFDSWLREEGIYEEVMANATRRVIACQAAVHAPKGPSKGRKDRADDQ